MSEVPQFWHVWCPVDERGPSLCYSAKDEQDARMAAQSYSRGRHATVANREGLNATYADGREVRSDAR